MYSSAPLDISLDIGDKISERVKIYANKGNLECFCWYHNEPIWIIRKEDSNIIRSLQIALYYVDDGKNPPGPYLRLIPNIYRVDKGQMEVPEFVSPYNIKYIFWPDLMKLYSEDPQKCEEPLDKALANAWKIAEGLKLNGTSMKYPLRREYKSP